MDGKSVDAPRKRKRTDAPTCAYTTRKDEPCKREAVRQPDGAGARACSSHWCSLPASASRTVCVYPSCGARGFARATLNGAPACDACDEARQSGDKPYLCKLGPHAPAKVAWFKAFKRPAAAPGTQRAQWDHMFDGIGKVAAEFWAEAQAASQASAAAAGAPAGAPAGAAGAAARSKYERERAELFGTSAPKTAPKSAPHPPPPQPKAAPPPPPPPQPRAAPPASARDDWAVLGVPRDASLEVVKRAFKHLAVLWHPDKTRDASAHAHFIEIKAAHDRLVTVLSDDSLL